MTKKNEIIQVVDIQQVEINNNTDISPYLFNIDRIKKPNCIMCQSEYRDEVESIYENQKKKNYSSIQQRLKDEHNFDISRDALRNHLVRHYARINNNLVLQDYDEEVQRWTNMQGNKEASMKARIAILEREYFTIASQSDDLDLFERRKNAECLKKIVETIILLENKLEEFAEKAKPVIVLFNQLTVIAHDEMAHVDSTISKKLVSKILSRLKESCGEMLTE